MNWIRIGSFDTREQDELNIEIGTKSEFVTAVGKTDKYDVVGSVGSVLTNADFMPNVTVTYTMVVSAFDNAHSHTPIEDFVNYFKKATVIPVGYQRLFDSFDALNTSTAHSFRLAVLKNFDLIRTSKDGETATFKISFDCKPQIFLISGENYTTVIRRGGGGVGFDYVFENPASFLDDNGIYHCKFARPELLLTAVGATQNKYIKLEDIASGNEMTIKLADDIPTNSDIVIDLETMNARTEVLDSLNRYVSFVGNIFEYQSELYNQYEMFGQSGSYRITDANGIEWLDVKTRFFKL